MIYDYIEHRTSRTTKQTKKWSKGIADYIIGQIDTTHVIDINDRLGAINGDISDEYYKKTLNPFNATDKKFTRFRADMRNLDIMKDVIRRYMGEFSKQPFNFQVKVNDPEVITRFNEAFNKKISELAVKKFINDLNAAGVITGQPNQEIPDFQEFYEKFKREYVDDAAKQGQDLLNAIIDWTDSNLKYYTAFYNYIVLGQTFTYRYIRGNQIYKEVINPLEYFPISNGEAFIEDHDKGVRKFKVTIPQLLENFSETIDTDTYNKIQELFKNYRTSNGAVEVPLSLFKSRLDGNTYTTFATQNTSRLTNTIYRLTNTDNTIDGYHVVFSTQVKVANVVTIDPITGTTNERIVESDTYTMNPLIGDVSMSWEWINEFWEVYRFGNEYDDIYSSARPIAYQRRDANNLNKVKSPYNGICEVVPGTGFTFSIPDAVLPFQIARNIFAFYREKIIAKNKDKIIIIPQSLLGDNASQEDKIYRMEANSTLVYDDSEDDSGTKAQHIRVLDASLSQYISHITDLMDRMKQEAWDTVDMNPQRYGQINSSAGKATTEEAIIRSSMGSVILFTMFEKFLEKEYTGDLEYSKVAYVNGKKGSFSDIDGNTKFLDLNVDNHILANYGVHVVSSDIETRKKRELKDMAFAAAQNGQFSLGVKSIVNNSVASIKRAFDEFDEAQQKYQASIANEKERIVQQIEETKAKDKQADRDQEMQIAQMDNETKLQAEIIKGQIALATLENQVLLMPEGSDTGEAKANIEREKLNLERTKQAFEMQKHGDTMRSKDLDRASKEKIASTNKNKYDKSK